MTELSKTTIRDVSALVTKGTTPTSVGRRFTQSGIRFIKVETIGGDGQYVPAKAAFIDADTHERLRRSQLREGDILFSIAGALGRSTVVQASWLPANTNQAFAVIRPSQDSRIDPRYLLWALRSEAIQTRIAEINVRAAQANLSLAQIRAFEIDVPGSEDQRRIARALDDADALIAGLQCFIARKEAIKRGVLQQLLAGKTRILGFVEPWRKVALGDVVRYIQIAAVSRAQLNTDSPLCYLHYGDIHTSRVVALDAARAVIPRVPVALAKTATHLEVGDLVFVDASEDRIGVGKAVEITSVPQGGIVAGLHTIAARFDKSVLADGFKAYLQFIPAFRNTLLRFAAGTKVLATTRSHISSVVLSLPSPDEQRAISAALRDCDEEIEVLRVRLSKTKSVKQGMMQQLLTGQTRLPAMEEATT